MEFKKITPSKLDKLIEKVKEKDISCVGKYLYKGFSLQISEHNLSGSERVQRLYHRRRAEGVCVVCGEKVLNKNTRTGKLYRLCEKHRQEIDNKEKK